MTDRETITDALELGTRALHELEAVNRRLDAIERHVLELAAAYALIAVPPQDAPRQAQRRNGM